MWVCIRRSAFVLILLAAAVALSPHNGARAANAAACPFCSMQGQTLVGDINAASMVLYGTFTNAQLNGSGEGGGTTDLAIESVIKKHEILGDQKKITLPRYIPPAEKGAKVKFLVFCDVFKGTIDPYRGVGAPIGHGQVLNWPSRRRSRSSPISISSATRARSQRLQGNSATPITKTTRTWPKRHRQDRQVARRSRDGLPLWPVCLDAGPLWLRQGARFSADARRPRQAPAAVSTAFWPAISCSIPNRHGTARAS